jgi:hypothetical protein
LVFATVIEPVEADGVPPHRLFSEPPAGNVIRTVHPEMLAEPVFLTITSPCEPPPHSLTRL